MRPSFSRPELSLWGTRPCPARLLPASPPCFYPFTASPMLCVPLTAGLLRGPLLAPFTPGPLHVPFPPSHLTAHPLRISTGVTASGKPLQSPDEASTPPPRTVTARGCVLRAHAPPLVPEDKRPRWSVLFAAVQPVPGSPSGLTLTVAEDKRTDRARARKGFPEGPSAQCLGVGVCARPLRSLA